MFLLDSWFHRAQWCADSYLFSSSYCDTQKKLSDVKPTASAIVKGSLLHYVDRTLVANFQARGAAAQGSQSDAAGSDAATDSAAVTGDSDGQSPSQKYECFCAGWAHVFTSSKVPIDFSQLAPYSIVCG